MNKILTLIHPLIVKNWKAWAGFVIVSITAWLAAHGVNLDMTIREVVEALVYGVGGFVVVWLSPRNK